MHVEYQEQPPRSSTAFQTRTTAHTLRRQITNGAAVVLTGVFALVGALFLIYLIGYVFQQGSHFLTLPFLTEAPAALGEAGGGVQPAIVGSLVLIVLASLFGIPLGVFTGIYLAEFGRASLASVVRFMVDTLTGIPTIIFGLFIWVLVVVPSHSFSGLAGGLALSIIMIPTVARTTEEVLRLVPRELREASIALGATESRTIWSVVLPSARNGIVTGIMLALARIAGETAPLLLTAFGSAFGFTSIFRPLAALPLQIFDYTLSPYDTQIHQAYAGSLILIALVILSSLAVRWVTGGFQLRRTGR
ncbi:MAG TPA: phosphate ABC transporter permease PstA [Ktedonobacterales bacterium]|jgi:phosphate transport system permease protein